MRRYQFVPISVDGRRFEAVEAEIDSDARAMARALATEFPDGCELWEGMRFIGRFHRPAPQAQPALVH